MRSLWMFLPAPVRREARRLAESGHPHPDPAVQDAAQSATRRLRWVFRLSGFAFCGIWAVRALTDPPDGLRPAGLIATFVMLAAGARKDRMGQIAAAQWPAIAARRPGQAEPVRLRLPAPWGLQSVVAVAAAPVLIMSVALWVRRRGIDPDQTLFMTCTVLAAVLLIVGVVAVARRRTRPALEVDRDGVRLPVRGLTVPWEQVAEVATRPDDRTAQQRFGLALRLRDPGAVWSARPTPLWRRLLWGRSRPRAWIFVAAYDVREPVFPAYAAALAFHADHLAADSGQQNADRVDD
ncbi:hypothetical protein [Catellatospora sichuanensis]|uniref:hypothetical protein n=1 Tax=Catellatospora sichuanensis TaxID=1969805 RepID=UPI001183BBA2|nr:hypothetical protein [Catellatospora sichuanensis]